MSGTSTGATTLTGATATANLVGTIASFAAQGFTLNDGESLTVTGAINGGLAATITDAGPLVIGGTVGAGAVGLDRSSIAIPGLVSDGGAGTVRLVATGARSTRPGR